MSGLSEAAAPAGLLPWSRNEFRDFGKRCFMAPHGAHKTGLFTDAALAALIDAYPRERIQAFTMGVDPGRHGELEPVDTAGIGGAEALAAIRAGRIWFKLQRINAHGEYGALVHSLYAALEAGAPHFKAQRIVGALILSSPGALVYFHADAKPNMIWHMRGAKRFVLYPDGHRTLIEQATMEDIYANAVDEEVPYDPSFEAHAQPFALTGGMALSWPQNTPHMVVAQGPLNVSISTFHDTEEGARRGYIYGANRFLRSLGLRRLSVKETGAVAAAKAFGYRALRRAGAIRAHEPNREYMARYRLCGTAPNGVALVPGGPVRTEFR
jgi:hypothetical protein